MDWLEVLLLGRVETIIWLLWKSICQFETCFAVTSNFFKGNKSICLQKLYIIIHIIIQTSSHRLLKKNMCQRKNTALWVILPWGYKCPPNNMGYCYYSWLYFGWRKWRNHAGTGLEISSHLIIFHSTERCYVSCWWSNVIISDWPC